MKKIVYIGCLCWIGVFFFSCLSPGRIGEKVVYLKDYMTEGPEGQDATLALRKALEKCKEINAKRLELTAGTLYFKPDYAVEHYVFVSNNDEGLKRFAFDLTGFTDLKIEGNGARLLFSGFICPFLIKEARNIEIQNLSIDYTRTFHSEGKIEARGEGWLEVSFPSEYPYYFSNGCLYFKDNQGNKYPYSNLLEFDVKKREPAYMVKDYWLSGGCMPAQEMNNGNVRIFKENIKGTPGNILVFGAAQRLIPAFTLTDSKGIRIQNVTIWHCGGMGVIAQRTGDIELDSVRVTPSPNSGRIISITADATHFSNCYGQIRMLNCLFENQKDDATNIHGIYAVIDSIINPEEIIVKLMHPAQWGFDFIEPGQQLEVVNHKSLIPYGELGVRSVERLNKKYTRVCLNTPLPAGTRPKDVVAAAGPYPDVLIRGCKIRNNRARGLLLGSRGKIRVEKNYFHVPGAAILFEGDGTYWYEQSGVRDAIIRENVFDNCNYGIWGKACIAVGSGIYDRRDSSRYHRKIKVEENTFYAFDPRLLNLYCVDDFVFKGNQVIRTDAYPYSGKEQRAFVIENCSNVVLQETEE